MKNIFKNTSGIKNTFVLAILMMFTLSAQASNDEHHDNRRVETLQIGGVGNVRFMDQTHGYASSGNGPFAALSFIVTSMEPQVDGSILATMEHDFLTPTGGWLKSVDTVIMIPIEGSPGVFSLQVKYNIVEGGSGMEGYEGQFFESRGFINTNTSIASVRYKGKIQRKMK